VSLLEVHGLSKRFGGLTAVADLSFTLAPAEVLGLIGPNGAGKTTVFNLLSGFLLPDAGEIRFLGRSLVGLKPHQTCRLGLARTFQIVRPFLHLTVLDNVKLGALARAPSRGEAEARARRVLAEVGLLARAEASAGSLTLAERKRLELARALATGPTLLLLDEVMAGLNATETERIVELIRGINARGIAILLIEHVMRAVMALSQRIVVMNGGQLIASAPPEVVANDPRVVEAYLGEEYAAGAASG
jgi:branched-chain amino acid transport system ATP-binding protein